MPTDTQAFCALVDWGTSNLRIWLVDDAGKVLREMQSAQGMGTIATPAGFAEVLETNLGALDAPEGIPVMAAGMVGARTGWVEARYLDLPVALDDLAPAAIRVPYDTRPVYILPGVSQKGDLPFDVMRGEETQLSGAVANGLRSGLFCMPGTHSKWVLLEDGQMQRFSTVMTGEMFDLISKQSILRLSLKDAQRAAPENPSFEAGVNEALMKGFSLTAAFFSIRAGALLADVTPSDSAARLSGLLIGAEVAAMKPLAPADQPVRLIGSQSLCALYARALELAGLTPQIMDGDDLVRHGLFAAAKTIFKT